jgi:hypothetical protein
MILSLVFYLSLFTGSIFSSSSSVNGSPTEQPSSESADQPSFSSLPAISVSVPAPIVLPRPMFSRSSGFKGVNFRNSAFESLLICLYSIPEVHIAIYDEAFRIISSTAPDQHLELIRTNFFVATAVLFVSLRLSHSALTIPSHFLDSLNAFIGINFIPTDYYCVSTLWSRIYQKSPDTFSNIFDLDLKCEFLHFDSFTSIKHSVTKVRKLLVRMNTSTKSVSEYIKNGHFAKAPSSFYQVTDPSLGPNSEKVSALNYMSLINEPAVLTVMLDRFSEGSKFNERNIIVDLQMEIGGVKYILMAGVEFLPESQTYRSYIHDVSVRGFYYFYQGRFTYPTLMDFDSINNRSVLLFYVPEAKLNSLDVLSFNRFSDIPHLVYDLYNKMNSQQESQIIKRKRSTFEEASSSMEAVRSSAITQPIQSISSACETNTIDVVSNSLCSPVVVNLSSDGIVESNSSEDNVSTIPFDSLESETDESLTDASLQDSMYKWNLIYKPNYSNYPEMLLPRFRAVERTLSLYLKHNSVKMLDIMSKYLYRTFSLGSDNFSFEDTESTALEYILIAITFNKASVSLILDLISNIDKAPVSQLVYEIYVAVVQILYGIKGIKISSIQKLLPSDSCGPYRDIGHFSQQLNQIIASIDNDIIRKPQMRTVEYSTLSTDDPDRVFLNISRPIDAESFTPKREAKIGGVWCDTVTRSRLGCRIRYIFFSSAAIFPVEINRLSRDSSELKSHEVVFTHDGHSVNTFIGVDPATKRPYIAVSRPSGYIVLNHGEVSRVVEKLSEEGKNILSGFVSNSIMIFFSLRSPDSDKNQLSVSKANMLLVLKSLRSEQRLK